jgi:hypothetical protein
VAALTDATVEFGLIPNDNWVQPSWINETKAAAARESMAKNGVIYGGASSILLTWCISVITHNEPRESPVSVTAVEFVVCSIFFRYRNMCRFNSGVRIRCLFESFFVLNLLTCGVLLQA